MAEEIIRRVTKWGLRLPNGDVHTCDHAEDAAAKRDGYRNAIEDEFGVSPDDYHPVVVQRVEITTATEWTVVPTEEAGR